MLVFDFQNYEGFKERFGIRECGNGNKSRQNKILLSYIKQHSLIKRALAGDRDAKGLLNIQDMGTLLAVLKQQLRDRTRNETSWLAQMKWNLDGWVFYTTKMQPDGQNGVCEDRDYRSVRYINRENGRVFKMRAGKFLRTVIDDTPWGRSLPEPVRLWFFEEFAQAWETHTRSLLPEYTLRVDDNFEAIYDSDNYAGDFGSCMSNHGYWTFYRDYVKAKAACLLNNEGKIIARCIIFTEVHVRESDQILRLAERQYCTDGEEVLKRCLVDALIKAGEIDGYKKVGASCHDGHNFLLNDETSLYDNDMWIECTAQNGDTCSYMDSFKYLNTGRERAYNSDGHDYDAELDTTSGYVESNENYDEYHDRYTCNDVVTVYYHGREMTCDDDELDDFVYVDGEYYHEDDVYSCDRCDEYYVDGEGYYSDITGETYCCRSCRDAAEQEYKEKNWEYSEYDDDYYESVETFINDDGDEETICSRSLMRLRDRGVVWFDDDNNMWNATVRETENEEA